MYKMSKTDRKDPDQEVKDFIFNVFRSLGFDSVLARTVGVLFIEPEEVSMEDLAKQTGYSISSISTKMKLLANTGSIQRIKKPGSKRVYFYMEKDIKKIMLKKINALSEAYFDPAKEKLPQIIDSYKKSIRKSKDANMKEKLRIVESYSKDIETVSNMIRRFRDELKSLIKD